MNAKLKIAGWLSMGVVAGALTTISVQSVAQRALAPLPLEELQQLAAVFGMIKTDYVEAVDEKKLISEAISGMVASLDPHSAYLEKKALKEVTEGITGKFVGVGIEISQEEGLVKVVSPIEGSPAFRAGLKPNDLITKIDDTAVKGLPLNEAVKRMRGEPNTKVILTILRREENNRIFPVTITREEIRTQSVRSKSVEPGYAWLRISQFQERTTEDFARKLEELYKADNNLKGLVLDFRNDPGGQLDAAVAIASAFLPDNAIVVTANGQLADAKAVYKASPEYFARVAGPIKRLNENTRGVFKKLPVVVLVNEGSASASEIVAGALQDHKRAKIMGSQTFGKGSVQIIKCLVGNYRIEDCPGAGVKLTVQRYYTPSGGSIQAKGIVPDIMVDESAEGNLFAALRTREADLTKHLEDKNDPAAAEKAKAAEKEREKEREEARKRLEEFNKKPEAERRQPEFGSDKDFQLQQAVNHLKGRDVMISKTLAARKDVPKEQ